MRRPLAVVCCAYVLTQLAAAFLPPAAFVPLAAVFVCLFAAALARKKGGYARLVPLACLAALAVQWVGVWGAAQPAFSLAGSRPQLTVRVEETSPGYADGMVRARLEVLAAEGRALGPLRRFCITCPAFPEAQPGEIYKGAFSLSALEKDSYYYGNLADRVYLEGESGPVERAGMSGALRFKLLEVRRILSASLRKYLPREEGGVLAAMTVGDRSHVSGQLRAAYRAAGASHLLVVSGLHLTLLCGAFLGNRPVGGRLRKLKALGAICTVLFMMGLTGFTPSVTRAGIAALIFYFGTLLLQPADSFTSLGVAAVLISLQGPYALCDLGLQLSFAATLGVLTAGKMARPLRAWARDTERKAAAALAKAGELLLCPVFAALFTLPVQLAGGLTPSGVSVLASLLALPLMGPTLVCGLLAGLCGLVPGLDFAARVFSLGGGLLVRLLNAVATHLAALPLARLRLPRGYALLVLALAALLWLAARRLRKMRWLAAVFPCMLALAVLCYTGLMRGTVRVALVGSASTPCVVAVEDGRALVAFQGGSANAQKVQEYLEEQGIGQIACLVDLRRRPGELTLAAQRTVTAQELPQNTAAEARVCDIIGTVFRLKGGNLLILDIKGCKLAAVTGKPLAAQPLKVDFLVGGGTAPGAIEPGTLLSAKRYDWHTGYAAQFYYASQGAAVWVRPGRSVMLKGGSYAVQ